MKQIISYLSLKENLPGLKFKKNKTNKKTACKQIIIILHSWKQNNKYLMLRWETESRINDNLKIWSLSIWLTYPLLLHH